MPRKIRLRPGRGAGAQRASMRPRPDAAEKPPGRGRRSGRRSGFNEAAARCRGKAQIRTPVGVVEHGASMRPRPDAAEKRVRRALEAARGKFRRFNEAAARCRGKRIGHSGPGSLNWRFNEAAARCRGKVRLPRRLLEAGDASMRPRPDAAENHASAIYSHYCAGGFNEAAARCRGKGRPSGGRPGASWLQ